MPVRLLLPSDADLAEALGAIEKIIAASPEAAAWNRAAFEAMIGAAAAGLLWVARPESSSEGSPVAFVCARIAADEAELLNLAVLPLYRRQGIATQLLHAVMTEAARIGARRIFLEVRSSNIAALDLYAKLGFSVSGRRRGYYPTTPGREPEDAIVLVRDLSS
jgi:ribosomal-protein-alanine N-acetyltransferase